MEDFKKVEGKVKSKVRAAKMRDRKKEFVEELKDRYSVSINEELVETI